MEKYVIFTDGATSGNPGPGGWGTIVSSMSEVIELGGFEASTTNNRMELMALIEGLARVEKLSAGSITIYCDSSYVIDGAKKNLPNWKNRNWKTLQGEPVKNQDLWQRLDPLLKVGPIEWKLIPGHRGIPGNERCDEIAVSYSQGVKPALFHGKKENYRIQLDQIPTVTKKSEPIYLSFLNGKLEHHKTWAECEARVKGQKNVRFKKVFSKEEEEEVLKSWGIK